MSRMNTRAMPAVLVCLAGIATSRCSYAPPVRILHTLEDTNDVNVTLPPLYVRRGERCRTTFPRVACGTPHTFALRGARGLSFSPQSAAGPWLPAVAGVIPPGEAVTEAQYWVNVDTSVSPGDTLAADFVIRPAGTRPGTPARELRWRRPIVVVAPLPGAAPASAFLAGVYPNPFNPTARVTFRLSAPTRVSITVFDAQGRRVATVIDRRFDPGPHTFTWDGTSPRGRSLASGVYFARLRAGSETRTLKMLLLK